MPNSSDFTSMWWTEGFPSHDSSREWKRAILTGYYALVMNTETLQVTNYGPLNVKNLTYEEFTKSSSDSIWNNLPSADLTLSITVNGVVYVAKSALPWVSGLNQKGPRLIHSGRFEQRSDIMNLQFFSSKNVTLNVVSRLEIVAWPKHLSFIWDAVPGVAKIEPGKQTNFGKKGPSYYLSGSNSIVVDGNSWDSPTFTIEMWIYVQKDFDSATSGNPWIMGKNLNEMTDGNYGLGIGSDLKLAAYLNIQGVHMIMSDSVNLDAWTHVILSYNGSTFSFVKNGELQGTKTIGKTRVVGTDPLVIGRRPDNCCGGETNGFNFVGFVDEIKFYDRALNQREIFARYRFQTPLCLAPIGSYDFNDGLKTFEKGYSLNSTNFLKLDQQPDSIIIAYEMWYYFPKTYTQTSSLFCKNDANSLMELSLSVSGLPTAYLTIGQQVTSISSNVAVLTCAWNHIVLQYNGSYLELYLNSVLVAQKMIAVSRDVAPSDLYFGRDCKNPSTGGLDAIIGEFKIYKRSLSQSEILDRYSSPSRPDAVVGEDGLKALHTFDPNPDDGVLPNEVWENGKMDMSFTAGGKTLSTSWNGENHKWNETNSLKLLFEPSSFTLDNTMTEKISITAKELNNINPVSVKFNESRGCFDIDLRGLTPINNRKQSDPNSLDAMERIILNIKNSDSNT